MAVFKSERFAVDLTTIEKPFGLLDRDTQALLRQAANFGAEFEIYGLHGWGKLPNRPNFDLMNVYRVRPTPKLPAIELPWDVIDPRWKWALMYPTNHVWLHSEKPNIFNGGWSCGQGRLVTDLFPGIRINVTDWKQSLTKRPE